MYKCVHFKIEELVHPTILKAIGETNSWRRLDADCLKDLDTIREAWGSPVYINSGQNVNRGLRPPNASVGAKFSTHKHGTTFDLVPGNQDYAGFWRFVYDMIADGKLIAFNTLEIFSATPTWIHTSKMNTAERPLIINP